MNRLIFSVSALFLAVSCFNFLSDLSSYVNQWGAVLLLSILLLSMPLAYFDPLFRGRRPGVEETVSEILVSLKGSKKYFERETDDMTIILPTLKSPLQDEVLSKESVPVVVLSQNSLNVSIPDYNSF